MAAWLMSSAAVAEGGRGERYFTEAEGQQRQQQLAAHPALIIVRASALLGWGVLR